MPSKEITPDQAERVSSWVLFKRGDSTSGYWYPSHKNSDGEEKTWIYEVGGEPLVIRYQRYTRSYRGVPYGPEKTMIFCSDKQAADPDLAKIVEFPPQGQIPFEEGLERR